MMTPEEFLKQQGINPDGKLKGKSLKEWLTIYTLIHEVDFSKQCLDVIEMLEKSDGYENGVEMSTLFEFHVVTQVKSKIQKT